MIFKISQANKKNINKYYRDELRGAGFVLFNQENYGKNDFVSINYLDDIEVLVNVVGNVILQRFGDYTEIVIYDDYIE